MGNLAYSFFVPGEEEPPPPANDSVITVTTLRSPIQCGPEQFYAKVDVGTGFYSTGAAAPLVDPYDDRWQVTTWVEINGVIQLPDLLNPRLMPSWRKQNRLRGQQLAFTLPVGTNSLVYKARQRNPANPSQFRQATYEETVVVKDPDVEFAGAKTFFVSNSGNWAGEPAGCVRKTSVSQALTDAAAGTGDRRIMLQDGETHTDPGNLSFNSCFAKGSILLVAKTLTGTKPLLVWTGGSSTSWKLTANAGDTNQNRGLIIQGIEVRGPWTCKNTTDARPGGLTASGAFGPSYLATHKCKFSGFNVPISAGETNAKVVVLGETEITNWRDYGCTFGNGHIGLYAPFIHAADDSWAYVETLEGSPPQVNKPEMAAIRIRGNLTFCVHKGVIVARGANVLNGSAPNQYAQINGTLRAGTQSLYAARGNISECFLQGTRPSHNKNSGAQLNPAAAIHYDACYFVAGWRGGTFHSERGGVQFSNCIELVPDLPYATAFSETGVAWAAGAPTRFFTFGAVAADVQGGLSGPNYTAQVTARFNTLVCLQTAAERDVPLTLWGAGNSTALNATVENNGVYGPNWSTPVNDAGGALDLTPWCDPFDTYGYVDMNRPTTPLEYFKLGIGGASPIATYQMGLDATAANSVTTGHIPWMDANWVERGAAATPWWIEAA